ncbi:isochorismatase family protein [Streptomyces coeruleorubidus]|uniref:isochorismatase family protein n=1 Tax=Streptomyces coeruleorubidus TaxID=116188 RepID=UPI0033C88EE4
MTKHFSRRGVMAATGGAAAAVTASMIAPQAAAAASKGRATGELFMYDNSALVLIDYQPEMVAGVHSIDTKLMMLNARVLARFAVKAGIPVVLSTVGVESGVNSPTAEELRQEIPDLREIDRTTMNAWDDDAFRQAVLKTGRRRFVMCGLWTEICLAYPIVDMQADGLRTAFVADAVGGQNKYAHDIAVDRMAHAGSVPNTVLATLAEWSPDWALPQGAILAEVGAWYQAELAKLEQG